MPVSSIEIGGGEGTTAWNNGTKSIDITSTTPRVPAPTADAGGFSGVPVAAGKNFDITIKVNSSDFPSGGTSIGLDTRQSTNAGSPHIAVLLGSDGKITSVQRTGENQASTSTVLSGNFANKPVWLREKRVGSVITIYYSLDGVNFTQLGTLNLGTGELVTGIWIGSPINQTVTVHIPNDAITFSDGTSAPKSCQESAALLADQSVWVGDRGKIKNGTVRGGTYSELGADTYLLGDLLSGGNSLMRERAQIVGNVKTVGSLSRQNQTTVTGTITQGVVQPACKPILEATPVPGTQNLNVGNNQTLSLNPGQYGDLSVQANGILNLKSGTYQFKSLVLQPDVKIKLDALSGPLIVKVRDNMAFGDRFSMTLVPGSMPTQVRFYSHQTTGLRLGTDSRFIGLLQAPLADITINSRPNQIGEATFYGSVQGKTIRLEPDVLVESLSIP